MDLTFVENASNKVPFRVFPSNFCSTINITIIHTEPWSFFQLNSIYIIHRLMLNKLKKLRHILKIKIMLRKQNPTPCESMWNKNQLKSSAIIQIAIVEKDITNNAQLKMINAVTHKRQKQQPFQSESIPVCFSDDIIAWVTIWPFIAVITCPMNPQWNSNITRNQRLSLFST